MKRKPTGFVATCQCGLVTGALDATRSERKDMGQILGGWLSSGCTVTPRFTGDWSVTVFPCECDAQRAKEPT